MHYAANYITISKISKGVINVWKVDKHMPNSRPIILISVKVKKPYCILQYIYIYIYIYTVREDG